MLPVELTKNDGELIIVNFETVRSFFEDKNDDEAVGTVIKYVNGDDLHVREPFAKICKVFNIASVKM